MFSIGQRWISETEPELGLGHIQKLEGKTLTLVFPLSEEARTYSNQRPPLKRVKFHIGDQIRLHDDRRIIVESVEEKEGLLFYGDGAESFSEELLSNQLQFSKPEDRFLGGLIDGPSLFQLRIETLKRKNQILTQPERGLMGGKISLIPHQLFVAKRVTEMLVPRVLLADEVGLGKTIEACLIIHRLLLNHQIERVMILLPDSLVHQWFFEFYRRFSLSFKMINQETAIEKGENPFLDHDRVIVSMGLLKGAPLARELLAKAKFDLLVIDEAHSLKSSDETKNFEFEMVKKLSSEIPGLLMLTATPEQFGQEDHFRRLNLLDPQKYHDFEQYKLSKESFSVIADLVRELQKITGPLSTELKQKLTPYFKNNELESSHPERLIEMLADRYGTGRSYFRNLRKTMDREFLFFPKRLLHGEPLSLPAKKKMGDPLKDHEIDASFQTKTSWLIDKILTHFKDEKILLICKSKKKILELEQELKKALAQIKTAAFHSDLSLMARDRQAAFFADPAGAQILLCTEVGSEGRNFEFCQNLVLFDLPLHPHPLEQRIGRLDRIGQKRDIHIFVPYIQATWEEFLFGWYHQGMNVFEQATESSGAVYEEMKEQLVGFLGNSDFSASEKFYQDTRNRVSEIEAWLHSGRDLLVEKNSFNPKIGMELKKSLTRHDISDDLSEYLDRVFNHFGVDADDIDASTWFIKPSDNMFVPSFPHLDSDGQTMTFSRTKALEREEMQFLTWDHPLVLGAVDLILSQNFGSNTVVMRSQRKAGPSLYFEAYYTLDCPAPKNLQIERFGAGAFMRFLIDDKGADLTEKFTAELIEQKVEPPSQELLQAVKKFPREKLLTFKKQTDRLAQAKFLHYQEQMTINIQKFYAEELNRLEDLSQYQESMAQREITELRQRLNRTLEAVQGLSLRFDSFRIIC